MRANMYMWFAFFASIAALGIAVIVVLLAVSYTASPKDFITYSYSEYIDRSDDMTFAADGGAQLYEAERAFLSSGAKAEVNAIASGDKIVRSNMRGSVVRYSITSDAVCSARLALSVCYLSKDGTDAGADELFSLHINGKNASARGVSVFACVSSCEFRENELCTVELKTGNNEIEITAESAEITIDYIVLISERERVSSDSVIGVPSYPFFSDGDAQRYEAEHAEKSGAVAFYDGVSSASHYVRFSSEGASIVFYPDSDGVRTATLAIAFGNWGDAAYAKNLCSVYVNGMETHMYPVYFDTSLATDGYTVAAVTSVTLGRGINAVRIERKSGAFDVDYMELNYGVNYSPYKNAMRFEAEDAFLSGGCSAKSDANASGGYGADFNAPGSNALFFVRSLARDEVYLSLRVRRNGSDLPLSETLTVSANGVETELGGVLVGDGKYADVVIGKISISEGDNAIEVESSVGYACFLDFITLSHAVYPDDGTYEAENAVFVGCRSERNNEASGGMNVGYFSVGGSVNYYIMSDAEYVVNLILSLSSFSSDEVRLSDCMKITVNGNAFGTGSALLQTTGSWTKFEERNIGEIVLNKGLNVISATCMSEIYNFDYIRLAR